MAPEDGQALPGYATCGPSRLIDRYQEVARLSRSMLEAAHREDWEEVARLEGQCRGEIVGLKRAAMIEPLSASEQQRRIELLRDMLRDDAQIRARAEPWLRELERLIGLAPSGPGSD